MQGRSDFPATIEVVVEIPARSRNKYEYDEAAGVIRLDRVLSSAVYYNFDYGFIEGTRADDGDHTDAMLLIDEPTFPGCRVWARPVGGLRMRDEKGIDFKVLCVALADPVYRHVDALGQVSPHKLREIEHFFETYKHLEDKSVETDGWAGVAETLELLREDRARWLAEQSEARDGDGLMAKPRNEVLEVAGREVTISNPDKVFFAERGHTKLDLVRYYLAVAEGALTGVRGRPMALKRFVNGAGGDFFFQKRAPDSRPEWIETVELSFPSGRTADEVVLRDAAQLAWIINLGCIDLNPHPVRAEDIDHPDELRVDLDPVPGVGWDQIRAVALVAQEALDAVGLVGWPKTSGSRGIHINVRIEPRWTYPQVRRAALALARDVERRAPTIATSKWWKEERHGVFLDYNQNAKDRTVASVYSVRPTPDARVSMPLAWSEVADVEPADFTLATVPSLFAELGDPGAGIDDAVGSLDALLELSARHEAEGQGDAPWPPHYAKQAGEPPRVQPSKQRRALSEYEGEGVEGGPPPDVAAARAAAVAAGDAEAGITGPPPWARRRGEPTKPTPTGRRKSSIPVIEIARAARKDEAMAGFERWKARHPDAATHLEPADLLVDSMRGRSTTWTRIRVNLIHVPEPDRPPQEALDPDYDPWTQWEGPDRSGRAERPTRKPRPAAG